MTLIHSITGFTQVGKTQRRALFVISKATFTKTAIKPKFMNRFSLKIFNAIIYQCSIRRISCPLKIFKVVYRRLKIEQIESFRFWDEDDYEYKIFSILGIAHAWTSVILAGRRDSRRQSTTSLNGGNKLSSVRCFIILLSGEGLTFTINNRI